MRNSCSIPLRGLIILAVLALIGVPRVNAFDVRTSDENMVRVDIKPIQLAAGKPALFEVRLNTHSVDLNDDMTEASLLQDNQGKVYQGATWKGSPPGGHHRRGTLEFPELEGTPQSIKLIIKGVSGVPERSFEWKLDG